MKDINSYQVWTAIITPMNRGSSVDYESLGHLLKVQEAARNAITILGSTGEALNIDEAERRAILDFAMGLDLDVPIMVGVGGINLHQQTEWVQYLNTLDVDAYLFVVPPYAKPGIHGQAGWFNALLDIAKKPVMLYNLPGRTSVKLEISALEMIKDHPNSWAVKEASGSEEEFAAYIRTAPNLRFMSGDDAMLPSFAKLGAEGVVSVASNVWPEATGEVARQCLGGSFQDTEMWDNATKALFCASNPVPVKALLHDLGRIKTPELRLPLSSHDMADIEIVRQANTSIESWFARQSMS